VKRIRIHIGGIYAGRGPAVVQTLLGSCVAVCLFDPAGKIGGMNHILLPGEPHWDGRTFDDSARFGINAMELLINRLLNLGAVRKNLQAKVFGGAHILRSIDMDSSPGKSNVEFVFNFLEFERFPVLSHDTGGHNARKIFFRTDTGEVRLKRIPEILFSGVKKEEREYRERIEEEIEQENKITFFRN